MEAPLTQDEEGNMYDVLLSEDASSPDKELLTDSSRKEIERALNTFGCLWVHIGNTLNHT